MLILFDIALMVAASFAIFLWELQRESALDVARTAGMETIVFCELFYLFNVRYFTTHAFHIETLRGDPTVMKVVRF